MDRSQRILPVYTGDVSGACSALFELGGMVVIHDPSGCNSTYNTHDETRRVIAAAGMRKYRRLFDARRVVRYLVETAAGESHSEPYEWAKEVYS